MSQYFLDILLLANIAVVSIAVEKIHRNHRRMKKMSADLNAAIEAIADLKVAIDSAPAPQPPTPPVDLQPVVDAVAQVKADFIAKFTPAAPAG